MSELLAGGDQAAASLQLQQQLADLLGVDLAPLRAFLALHWSTGDADACTARLAALQNAYVRRAAAERKRRRELRGAAPGPAHANMREVIDELLRIHPRWTKDRAFQHKAVELKIAWGTVRNAYYRPAQSHTSCSVITAT